MKWKLAVAALTFPLLLGPAAPAFALEWSLGADLGGSLFMPGDPDASGVATFSWPMTGPGSYQMGGARLGFAGKNPAHEVWVGTSYGSLTTEGRTSSRFMTCANYQYNFTPQSRVSPYATAGFGVVNYANSGSSAAGVVFGMGAGLARSVTDGAGRFRAELRYDQQTEGRNHGFVVVPRGGMFGLKLGFDLWVR